MIIDKLQTSKKGIGWVLFFNLFMLPIVGNLILICYIGRNRMNYRPAFMLVGCFLGRSVFWGVLCLIAGIVQVISISSNDMDTVSKVFFISMLSIQYIASGLFLIAYDTSYTNIKEIYSKILFDIVKHSKIDLRTSVFTCNDNSIKYTKKMIRIALADMSRRGWIKWEERDSIAYLIEKSDNLSSYTLEELEVFEKGCASGCPRTEPDPECKTWKCPSCGAESSMDYCEYCNKARSEPKFDEKKGDNTKENSQKNTDDSDWKHTKINISDSGGSTSISIENDETNVIINISKNSDNKKK